MYKPGSIVLIKMHPASGKELKKFRPALVLKHHVERNFVTFIPFTSQAKIYSTTTEFVVTPTKHNNLEKPSLLLCWYIQTAGSARVQSAIGTLDQANWQNVIRIIKRQLSLL